MFIIALLKYESHRSYNIPGLFLTKGEILPVTVEVDRMMWEFQLLNEGSAGYRGVAKYDYCIAGSLRQRRHVCLGSGYCGHGHHPDQLELYAANVLA